MKRYSEYNKATCFELQGLYLSDDQKRFFDEEGYIVLKPSKYTKLFRERAYSCFTQFIPEWEVGFRNRFIEKFRSPHLLDADNVDGVMYRGTSHINRRRAGKLKEETVNILSGRRAVLRGHKPNLTNDTYALVEDSSFTSIVKSALGADGLSVSNFSLASVFPEHTGEDVAFHSDLSGFSKDPLSAYAQGDTHVLAIMYLSDVDSSVAPLRIWPKTHKEYFEINEYIAETLGYGKGVHAISNLTNYAELLPDWIEAPVDCIGPSGSIVLMNNTVIHCATENYSKNSTRKTFFATYSPRSLKLDVKRYSAPKTFFESIDDKALIAQTFYCPSKIEKTIDKAVRKAKTILKSGVKSSGLSKKPRKLHDMEQLQALNFGAATSHPDFLTVDGSDDADITMNFSTGKRINIKDASIKIIYSSHSLEHLLEETVITYLQEFHRVLKVGGTLRITLPDAKKFFDAYDNRDLHFFDWVRSKGIYKQDSWLRLVLRHFCDPVLHQYTDDELYQLYSEMSYEELLDRLCGEIDRSGDIDSRIWGHQSWWNEEKLSSCLKHIGFKSINNCACGQSDLKVLQNKKYFDSTKPHMSLFIECKK